MTDFNLDSFHLSEQDSEAFYLVKTIKLNGSFPGGSDSKESACNAGDLCLIPGSGRLLGQGNGNPLQYSCLGNPMGRGQRTEEPGRLQSMGSQDLDTI